MPPQDAEPTPSFGGFGINGRVSYFRRKANHFDPLLMMGWSSTAITLMRSADDTSDVHIYASAQSRGSWRRQFTSDAGESVRAQCINQAGQSVDSSVSKIPRQIDHL